MLDRLANDPEFPLAMDDIQQYMDPDRYTGRSAQQVEEFLAEEVFSLLRKDLDPTLLGCTDIKV